MAPPPGVVTANTPQPGGRRDYDIPSTFTPPTNMPNINFNAPVIRMGVGADKANSQYGYDNRRGGNDQSNAPRGRMGLGADSRNLDSQRQQVRDNMISLIPPTKEEVSRTIFITGLVPGCPDNTQIEELLDVGRGLRRWTRAEDADGKSCTFGFAEFADALTLEIATEVLQSLRLPLREKGGLIKDEEGNTEEAELKVVVDDQTTEYIQTWNRDRDRFQFELERAQEAIEQIKTRLSNPETHTNGTADRDGDVTMGENGVGQTDAELITIPVGGAEDELADIPAELRETVAAEIAAFRERSNRRDLERLRKEEEYEAAERARGGRVNRLASPPPSAPSGPAGANGIPVGPRGVSGAPSGPKGYRGVQLPRDGETENTLDKINGFVPEDEDDSASDSELERRRNEKKRASLEKAYLDQERKWFNRERLHQDALARQKADEARRTAAKDRHKEATLQALRDFDDEEQLRKPTEEFYRNRRAWARDRRAFRSDERRRDDKDRLDEEREQEYERRKYEQAQGKADDFLAGMELDLGGRAGEKAAPRQFAFNLGLGGAGAGAAPEKAAPSINEERAEPEARKGAAQSMEQVEGLLDEEEEEGAADRKTLQAVSFQPLAAGEKMTDEERKEATRQLAASIPSNTDDLFAWNVKWDSLKEHVVADNLRPYVEKKIMESLGVQEDLLVDFVEEVIKRHGKPQEIQAELETMMEDEAADLTKKVWRMVVFYSESEARGLSG
ncbi:hypothetical protein H2203_007787 [Taxawa tesnikishii (nom. ined.)]|nr:hypothetical protein H2203_007787 [Dothideales sp. JES 119]